MIGREKKKMEIINKVYCSLLSNNEEVLMVRKRPNVVNGGGFVVMDSSGHRIVFKVDGYGVPAASKGDNEFILRQGNGSPLLRILRKGGMVEALSIYKKWKGYSLDYEGSQNKLVFTLKEPNCCLIKNKAIRIFTKPNKGWDFKINGCFPDKCCTIVDSKGNQIAQVGMKKEVENLMESKDLYQVVVKPGMDQAFVFGVITILHYIYG